MLSSAMLATSSSDDREYRSARRVARARACVAPGPSPVRGWCSGEVKVEVWKHACAPGGGRYYRTRRKA
eukprot:1876284-Prymnesium_polylepis.2